MSPQKVNTKGIADGAECVKERLNEDLCDEVVEMVFAGIIDIDSGRNSLSGCFTSNPTFSDNSSRNSRVRIPR